MMSTVARLDKLRTWWDRLSIVGHDDGWELEVGELSGEKDEEDCPPNAEYHYNTALYVAGSFDDVVGKAFLDLTREVNRDEG